jgi:cation diffusion facilitator CzcD-associated flavoprotein CzcO
MGHSQILQESVGIIGAGVAGLMNAQVLLKNGFLDVNLISRDGSVGGTWARTRVFTLTSTIDPFSHFRTGHLKIIITSVHGKYRLFPLDMPPPQDSGERLSDFDLCDYMEKFADKFLFGRANFTSKPRSSI